MNFHKLWIGAPVAVMFIAGWWATSSFIEISLIFVGAVSFVCFVFFCFKMSKKGEKHD